MPGPSTSRSSVGKLIGRPHTRHRRPVPRRIEEMPVAANNSRFDNRARTSCLRSASRAGIIAGSRSGLLLGLVLVDGFRLAWSLRKRRYRPRLAQHGRSGWEREQSQMPQVPASGERQPESPQEARTGYTPPPCESCYFSSPSTTISRRRPSSVGTGIPSTFPFVNRLAKANLEMGRS
jgi:hypothetical protein